MLKIGQARNQTQALHLLNPVGLGLSKNPSYDAKLSLTPSESLLRITSPPSLISVLMQLFFSKKSSGNSGLIPAFVVLLRMPGPSFSPALN